MQTKRMTTTQIHDSRQLLLARALWFVYVGLWLFMLCINIPYGIQSLQDAEPGVQVRLRLSEHRLEIAALPDTPAAAAGLPLEFHPVVRYGDFDMNLRQYAFDVTAYAPYGQPFDIVYLDDNGQPQAVTVTAVQYVRAFMRFGVEVLGLPPVVVLGTYVLLTTVVMLVTMALAVLIAYRKRSDRMGLLSSALLFALSIAYSHAFGPNALPGEWAWLWYLLFFTNASLIILLFLVFPSGQVHFKWSLVILAAYMLVVFSYYFRRLAWAYGFSDAFVRLLEGPEILLTVSAFFVQVYAYRVRHTREQKQQTKWVLIGFAAAIVAVYSAYLFVFFRLPLWLAITVDLLQIIGFLGVPVTLAFAMMRYRLYEVDLVINRGLVFGLTTLILSLVFGAVFLVVNRLVVAVLGQEHAEIAAVVSTALVVLLFNPARKRAQQFIDRNLYHLRLDLNALAEQQERIAPMERAARPGPLTGTQIGEYALGDLLGKGGMGEVYYAQHATSSQRVAIKVLPSELADNPQFRARFEREAKIAALLRHANIVPVFDYGTEGQMLYMVMDYVEGQDLSERIKTTAPLPLAQTVQIVRDIASALDYAHGEGLVHRDVKPSNIMLQALTRVANSPNERAVLMDFGIVKLADATTALTNTGMVGTLEYAAPEQILSAHEVDHRADIYALGVVTYQMLTGELPFKGGVGQLVFAHLQQPPPDPHTLNNSLPFEVSQAVLRCMSKSPSDRFDRASDLASALVG